MSYPARAEGLGKYDKYDNAKFLNPEGIKYHFLVFCMTRPGSLENTQAIMIVEWIRIPNLKT